jgi:hypothetical protein
LTTQVVKSAFAGLPVDAQLPKGKPLVLQGRSWSGNGAIKAVDVSLDGGTTWRPAKLAADNVPLAGVRWATVPFNDAGYVFGAIVRHPVTIV